MIPSLHTIITRRVGVSLQLFCILLFPTLLMGFFRFGVPFTDIALNFFEILKTCTLLSCGIMVWEITVGLYLFFKYPPIGDDMVDEVAHRINLRLNATRLQTQAAQETPLVRPAATPKPMVKKPKKTTKKFKPFDRSGYVYLVKSQSGLYKIGHTKNPDKRIRRFEVKLPFEVEFEHIIPCQDRIASERALHQRFADQRVKGTEWFELTPDNVLTIKAIDSL